MKGQNFERKTYTNTDFVNVNFTLKRCDLANTYGIVSLAGIDSKMIDCKHVALCTDAVKLEVFDNDELTATSYKTALFS